MIGKHPRTPFYITKTKGKALRKKPYERLDDLAKITGRGHPQTLALKVYCTK